MIGGWQISAAVAAGALAVGAASGAWVNGQRWEAKYQAREIELLATRARAEDELQEARDAIRDAAADIERAPVRRVLCTTARPAAAALPGDSAAAAVGAGGAVPADRDYGPALRECLALAARVAEYDLRTRTP